MHNITPYSRRFSFFSSTVQTTLLVILLTLPIFSCYADFAKKLDNPELVHAISRYGTPKYPKDFTHFNYVNPNAPKGGELKQSAIGSFDSLNLYINKGTPVVGCNLLYDTLLARSWDEPLSKYGLLAEKIELDPKNLWVAFHINPKARFHDGTEVTAQDVSFSFNILREKGKTFYKSFYAYIKKVEATSKLRVVFTFTDNKNEEGALILGQMPVFPEHYWKDKDFAAGGLAIPVGSGPYKVHSISPGRKITYIRNQNYWAKDLAPNKGRFNYDLITYEYFLDSTVATEALLNGIYDIKVVVDPKISNQLNARRLKRQNLIQSSFPNQNPQTLTLVYNIRRSYLRDDRVRKAISYAFNFDWINKKLFSGVYDRGKSLFSGTPLESRGIPNAGELQLLSPFRKELPEKLFNTPYIPPGENSEWSSRDKQKAALTLLKSAGWELRNNYLYNTHGERMNLEMLLSQSDHKKIALPIKRVLESYGITLQIHIVDSAQYYARVANEKQFDMILHTFPHTPSPGTEQKSYWDSSNADVSPTQNLVGVKNPIIDKLTNIIQNAHTWNELKNSVSAMDRVLLWNYYILPLWYLPKWTVIHKSYHKHPTTIPPYILDLLCWWHEA